MKGKKMIASVLSFALILSNALASHSIEVSAENNSNVYTVTPVEYYTIEDGVEGTTTIYVVENPKYQQEDAPILTYSKAFADKAANLDEPLNPIISKTIDGYTYAFKDMNLNGVLDPYEDWRLSPDERAENLATMLIDEGEEGIKKIAGLMLFSSHERNAATDPNGNTYAPGLTDSQRNYLSSNYVRNITDAAGNDVEDSVGWVNAMQQYVEASEFNVPINFSSDPRSTAGSGDLYSDNAGSGQTDISRWPSNIGLAATFDTNHMYEFAKASSSEYRALGIVTALGPQIDLATEPRWLRVGGTFGEDAQLASDMATAYVDGSQSTYDEDGTM